MRYQCKDHLYNDLLFMTQIVLSVAVCVSQTLALLDSTQGQLLSRFFLLECYLVLQLSLAHQAYWANPSREAWQAAFMPTVGMVLTGVNILAYAYASHWSWSMWKAHDLSATLVVAVGCAIVTLYALASHHSALHHTIPRALYAMSFKALPLFVLTVEVARHGGAGIPPTVIVLGHVSILLRLLQLGRLIRAYGWEEHLRWLFINELVTEVSWLCVTIAWIP